MLGLIVATYVTAVSFTDPQASPIVVLLQIVTVWFALRTSRARRGTRLVADVILVVALLVALGSAIGSDDEAWRGLPFVSALLYFVAPISIIRHLVTRPAVDQETVLGALSAYLLIGMFFAFTYRGIGSGRPGRSSGPRARARCRRSCSSASRRSPPPGTGTWCRPANPGQTFAVAEMLIGQLFLITTFGKLVNAWRPARWSTAAPATTDEAQASPDTPTRSETT